MHGSAHSSSEVGWARSDVTEVIIVGEFRLLFDFSSGDGKSFKDLADVGALLHRDDTELILFVDPDKERLVFVMEDSTGFGPLALESTALKVLITSLEKEMVSDELFFVGVTHGGERVVLSLEFSSEILKDTNHGGFNFSSLLSGNCSAKGVVSHVAANTDSCRVDH